MQTAKNLFLWPGRSWWRKGFEVYFTLLLETSWSKRRIMEAYLNIVEWGPGIYGAEGRGRAYHFPQECGEPDRGGGRAAGRRAAQSAALVGEPADRLYPCARPA